MNKYYCFFVFIILFVSCNPKATAVKSVRFSHQDYIELPVKLYEAKEPLFPILDSIIFRVNRNSEYVHQKQAYTISIEPSDNDNNLYTVSLYGIRYSDLKFWIDSALFYYRGYEFALYGEFLPEFFLLKKEITYWRIGRQLRKCYSYGEAFCGLEFKYKNGEFLESLEMFWD